MTPDGARDPGASVERTALAWHRTGLSAAATAAVSARAFLGRLPAGPLLTVCLVALVVVAYLPAGTGARPARHLRATALLVAMAAALALALAASGP